jgi:hypothetical protein
MNSNVSGQVLIAAAAAICGAALLLALWSFERWRRRTAPATARTSVHRKVRLRVTGALTLTLLSLVAMRVEHWRVTLWAAFILAAAAWLLSSKAVQ